MACDVMSVRLHLPLIRVLGVIEDAPARLEVGVESALRRLRCPQCGFMCQRVRDRRDKRILGLEVSGRRAVPVWSRRRMRCGGRGGRFLEDHRAFEGALTARLARAVVADAGVMTLRAAARGRGVGWHRNGGLARAWADAVAERRRSRRWRVLLADEASIRRGRRYVTVIVNADTGKALAMVPRRGSAALSAFPARQGHRWCKGVEAVATDGSRACKAASAPGSGTPAASWTAST